MKTKIRFNLPTQKQLDEWQAKFISTHGTTKAAYLQSYSELLEVSHTLYLRKQFKALGYMAYGWMPTICKKFNDKTLESRDWETACKSNNVKVIVDAISHIKNAPFNNSWVGTSKVLHFINPSVIPIWDSRVRNTIHSYQLHNVKTLHTNHRESFIAYLEHTHELLENRSVDLLKTFLDDIYQFNHSQIRVIELIYFSAR